MAIKENKTEEGASHEGGPAKTSQSWNIDEVQFQLPMVLCKMKEVDLWRTSSRMGADEI